MIPKIVADALEASRSATELFVNEQPGLLVAGGKFAPDQLQAWAQVASVAENSWCKFSLVDSIGKEWDRKSTDFSIFQGENIRISLRYEVPLGAVHAFSVQGLRKLLASSETLIGISTVRIADDFDAFQTRGPLFEPWVGEPVAAPVRKAPAPDRNPRRYVRSALTASLVPSEADPWLLAEAEISSSRVLAIWKSHAVHWMALTLLDEIYDEGAVTFAVLHGPPTRRLKLGKAGPFSEDQFAAIAPAAQWVFGEGTDVETKHTLLTNELARLWGVSDTYFDSIFDVALLALDGARTAYAAHLKAGSRETIRSLSELRKSLADEALRITDQTRALATSLWRDVAIAIGAAAFKTVLDISKNSGAANAGTEHVYVGVLAATILYLVARMAVATWINDHFLSVSNLTRRVWRRKIYGFVSDEDFLALAQKPLDDTTATYDRVLLLGWIVTYVACGVLEILAVRTLQGL